LFIALLLIDPAGIVLLHKSGIVPGNIHISLQCLILIDIIVVSQGPGTVLPSLQTPHLVTVFAGEDLC